MATRLKPTRYMVDHEARQALSLALRRLVTGRMTNDEFDDLYYGSWVNSSDRAVDVIATSAYCLYSSDVETDH
ncbi:MAG TPA: hypothetical protein VND64_32650 [Pirellulales bacterium]|nr:hypothetical protein [Pirellulales bacterium]